MGSWDELVPSDPHMRTTHLVCMCLGAFITLFGLVSLVIKERLYMSEAMVAIIVGVVVGPLVGKWIDPATMFGSSLHSVSIEFCRIVIGIQCMACGVDLPGNYVFREWISVAMLLGPVMMYMWLVSALGVYLIFGLGVWDCLIIAACMTPTDPILANSVVKGKFAEMHIPLNVRLILSAESGSNDGLGSPFLLLAVFLLRHPSNPGEAIGEWAYKVLLYQVALSVVIGIVIAYMAQLSLKMAVRHDLIDKESILSFTIALSLFLVGFVSLIGSNDFLAAFVAGNVLTWWFGPIGAGAVFYANLAVDHLGYPPEKIMPIVYFIVVASVVVHGGSVALFNLSLQRTQTIQYAQWEDMRHHNSEHAPDAMLPLPSPGFRRSRDEGGANIIEVLSNAPATMKAALDRMRESKATSSSSDARETITPVDFSEFMDVRRSTDDKESQKDVIPGGVKDTGSELPVTAQKRESSATIIEESQPSATGKEKE
ncbi:hypothetical protein HDU81_007002 [Chytriomyces hyalinus]|nr:hypothetical protein HDU81_007002 [Chytriomyces hyalinus]